MVAGPARLDRRIGFCGSLGARFSRTLGQHHTRLTQKTPGLFWARDERHLALTLHWLSRCKSLQTTSSKCVQPSHCGEPHQPGTAASFACNCTAMLLDCRLSALKTYASTHLQGSASLPQSRRRGTTSHPRPNFSSSVLPDIPLHHTRVTAHTEAPSSAAAQAVQGLQSFKDLPP